MPLVPIAAALAMASHWWQFRPEMAMNPDNFRKRTRFIVKLGRALHECGASSERIERHLTNVTSMLDLNGSVLISPTTFTCAFWEDDELDQFIHIERVEPADYNLGQLWEIDRLVEGIAGGQVDFSEGLQGLKQLTESPRFYSTAGNAFAWALIGGSFAALLSANPLDCMVASVLALVSFLIVKVSGNRPSWKPVEPIMVPFVTGLLAAGLAASGVGIKAPFVILSSIIVFIPGLALTIALTEISAGHLISGSSRLVDAAMLLLKLFFGAISGMAVVGFLWQLPAEPIWSMPPMPGWRIWLALGGVSFALSIAFNIPPKKMPLGLLAAAIAFITARLGESYLGMYTGMFIGAFAVGLYSNLFARITHGPGSILMTQGLILLVPGSKIYNIVNHWISGEDVLPDTSGADQAVMALAALIAGLLFSNAILPSRKSL